MLCLGSKVLVSGLDNPWSLLWGPDSYLWLTERTGKSIKRINPKTDEVYTAGTIDEVFTDVSVHKGLLGLALSPKFGQGDDTLYVYYTYKDGETLYGKIVKFNYAKDKITGGTIVIDKFPAGNDHNAERLVFSTDGRQIFIATDKAGNGRDLQGLPTNEMKNPGAILMFTYREP
ncbi:MAG: PQQ-dependent sugar dehydrogenase [Planctomycetaceae bacterium]|jgi:glucose/arabinose dehydrogenase|nr:PQQ-dependent sugar dehydrogenase [Planctomycetaceae bacterium]